MKNLRKILVSINLLLLTTQIFAKDACVQDGMLSNVDIYVFSQKNENITKEHSFNNLLDKKVLSKTSLDITNKEKNSDYDFLKKTIKNLIPLPISQKYYFNDLSMTYHLNDKVCVLSFPYEKDKIKNLKFNDKIVVYINGSGYMANSYITLLFQKSLENAGLLEKNQDFILFEN
jgi:hypothetical protein